ncbi:MAG: hypothetical protein GXP24_10775 [Planctomycetes bacterium]|nr:hypothetical protein [Planctomycetota bacterium]
MQSLSRRQFIALGGAAAASQWVTTALPCRAAPQPLPSSLPTSSRRWVDHQSYGPFQCQATFPLGNLTPLFQELSALELELQRTLAVPPAAQTVNVYLLENKQSHRQLLNELFPRVPYRRALYVQRGGRGSVYAYRHRELAVDLRHECTHALLHTNLSMVPLWLDEGLAEYFEMPAEQRAFDHPHFKKLRFNRLFGMIPSIESLEAHHDLVEMGGPEYRFAWAWVHFMLHGPLPVHRALVHYLADIRRGNPPGKLSERLHQAMPDLERQLALHFKKWRR